MLDWWFLSLSFPLLLHIYGCFSPSFLSLFLFLSLAVLCFTPSLYSNSTPFKSVRYRAHIILVTGIFDRGMEVKSLQSFYISFFSLCLSLSLSLSQTLFLSLKLACSFSLCHFNLYIFCYFLLRIYGHFHTCFLTSLNQSRYNLKRLTDF